MYVEKYKVWSRTVFFGVCTNVGYSVVGQFMAQSETAEHMQETLQIPKNLEPRVEEAHAVFHVRLFWGRIIAVLPGVTAHLCAFHQEQAWERWTRDGKHGLNEEERDQLLYLLRDCAANELVILNTFFQHKDIHKYTWGSRGARSQVHPRLVWSGYHWELEQLM